MPADGQQSISARGHKRSTGRQSTILLYVTVGGAPQPPARAEGNQRRLRHQEKRAVQTAASMGGNSATCHSM